MPHRRNPARGRGEEGSALVTSMIVFIFVATVVTAGVSWTFTGVKMQNVHRDRRTAEYDAAGAIDAAAATIADDATLAIWDTSGPASQPCDPNNATFVYDQDEVANTGDEVTVSCATQENSGSPKGLGGYAFDHVVFTTGGQLTMGQRAIDVSSDPSPFCDDYQHSGGDCEAGLYIGRGATDLDGVVVQSNGSTAGKPLVVSNSSIIVRSDSDPDRKLQVEGDVWARRDCTAGRVIKGWSPAGGGTDARVAGQCNKEPAGTNPPEPIPVWGHNRANLVTGQPGEVPPHYSVVWNSATTVGGPCQVPDPVQPYTYPGDAVASVKKTACPTGTFDSCTDGYVEFQPGYYSDLDELDAMFDPGGCPRSFYWFRPGVYYFDFDDEATPKWREPNHFSQVLGGTPDGWTPCTGVSPITNCAQPVKYMTTNKYDVDYWGIDCNGDKDNDDNSTSPKVCNGGTKTEREAGDPQFAVDIDGKVARTIGDGTRPNVLEYNLLTPISEPHSTVTGSALAIVHDLETPLNTFEPGYPRVVIRVTGLGSCTVPVDGSDDTTITLKDRSTLQDVDYAAEIVDLTNGCPGTASSGWPGPIRSSYSAQASKWVNDLRAQYEVGRAVTATPPRIAVDGMAFRVNYSGPPAPRYPGGCDPEKTGVQWILGNRSRLAWVGNDVHVELCGSEAPAVVNPKRYATAIYGLWGDHLDGQAGSVAPAITKNITGLTVQTGGTYATKCFPNNAALYDNPGDGLVGDVTWGNGNPVCTDGSVGRLTLQVPANSIPLGSVIERVEVRIDYWASNAVSKVETAIGEDSSAKQDLSDNDGGASAYWPLHDILPVNRTVSNGNPVYATWRYGAITDRTKWPAERDLSEQLRTAQGINSAELRFDFTGAGVKRASVDNVDLIVMYRPPATFRPLRGCATLRAMEEGPGKPTHQYTGTDSDWYPDIAAKVDEAFHWDADQASDGGACSLLHVKSNSGDEGGNKLHVVGLVYAPTAALDFSGRDNEAPMVTGGIVARTLSINRWRKTLYPVPTLGAQVVTGRDPREVVFEARDVHGTLIERAHCFFDDVAPPGTDPIHCVERRVRP